MHAQEAILSPVDTRQTREVVEHVAGYTGMLLMNKEPGTLTHQLRVGSMMAGAMIENGFEESSEAVLRARITGGLHDIGKYHPQLLHHVTSPEAWTPDFRQSFREAHCKHGESFLLTMPHAIGSASRTRLASQVARQHHSDIPEDYAEVNTTKTAAESEMWGYVDLLQPFDRAEAVGSAARAYIKNREGMMTAQRVFEIALGGRTEKQFPTIEGRQINFIPYLTGLLGL